MHTHEKRPHLRVNDELRLDSAVVVNTSDMRRQYRRRREEHGLSPRSLFYSSDALHEDRLAQAGAILRGLVSPEDSLLDAGCGYGSLAGVLPACAYRGVDVIEDFIQEARRRRPECVFTLQDILAEEEQCDWTVMIGALGTMPEPEEKIAHCCRLARKGIVLDVLDARKSSGEYNHFYVGAVVEFLLDQSMATVTVHNPPQHPWTFLSAWRESILPGGAQQA